AFVTSLAGQTEVFSMNPDGSDKRNLSNYAAGPDDNFDWRPRPNTPAGPNVTVTSNGAAVTFSNVTTAGETTITPIDPNSLSGVPGEYVINANSLAFEIHTTAVYTGPIAIGFQVPGVNNPIDRKSTRLNSS